ncbi:MAG: DUF5667 domain-containing protein [Patescibacteria group bacterium]
MANKLIGQLKDLKRSDVSPRPEWLKSSRARLLSQIKNTVPTEELGVLDNLWFGLSILMPQKFVFNFVRPLAVLLIVALVGTSGWIATVDAAYEAVPGDWLYPAKRAVEKTQITTAVIMGAKNTETKLHSEFAKRRATEIKSVMKSDMTDKNEKVTTAVSDLKNEIKSVSDNLDELKSNGTQGTAETAKAVQSNAEQIKVVLTEIKDDLNTGTSTLETKVMAKEIGEAKDLTKDANIKVVEVLIAKHLDGDVTKEEVTAAIDKTMQSAVDEANVTQQNVQNMNTAVTAAGAVPGVTVSSSPSTETIGSVASTTGAAAVKTHEAAAELGKQVTEIKSLVESGNLTDAVNIMKQANETSKEMDKLQDTTLVAAQTVLPTPVVNEVKNSTTEVAQTIGASTTIQVIVSSTTQATEPGKLPVTVIVTTTPASSSPSATVSSTTKK